jgi:hypothetical protein
LKHSNAGIAYPNSAVSAFVRNSTDILNQSVEFLETKLARILISCPIYSSSWREEGNGVK